MIEIRPFQALIYNSKKFSDLSRLVCPPYDVISRSQQAAYYRLSSYNMIRLILGKAYSKDSENNNRYTRAEGFLKRWVGRGVLIKDSLNSIYVYEQRYNYQGRLKTRHGFVSLLKIQADMIHPHEHTHLEPKEDRLQLLKRVKANLSPIFVLFSDAGHYIPKLSRLCAQDQPVISVVDSSGIRNRLWHLQDTVWLERLNSYMRDKDIFIADGHHRFEVACAYRDMLKYSLPDFSDKAPYNYIMAYFTNIDSQDLTVMATHRLLKAMDPEVLRALLERLGRYFQVEGVKSKTELIRRMKKASGVNGVFGMYLKNNFYILRLKAGMSGDELGRLDVSVFNKFILKCSLNLEVDDKNIIYSPEMDEAISLVRHNKAKAAFFLNPTRISQLKKVVLNNQRMPPKSTYFYPKLPSGLLIHKF